jgi:hypothetical protein
MRVLIYKRDRAGYRSSTVRIGHVDVEITDAELRNPKVWREKVLSAVRALDGNKVESVNRLSTSVDGAHVVVTLSADPRAFGRKVAGKPVTIGGRPIAPPKARRTIAKVTRGGQ